MWPNPRFFFVTGGLILIFHTGKGDRKYFPFPLSPPNPLLPLSPFQALFPLSPSYSYEFPSKTLFFLGLKNTLFFSVSRFRGFRFRGFRFPFRAFRGFVLSVTVCVALTRRVKKKKWPYG